MKRLNHIPLTSVFLSSLLVAAPAISAGTYGPMSQLPPMQTQGSVTYMSGGIGQTEAAAMRREQTSFPLTLEFVKRAATGTEYLAGVNVTISDHRGETVLSAVSGGPFLLARLPDGKYTVTANDNGRTERRDVVVAEHKQEHVVFTW